MLPGLGLAFLTAGGATLGRRVVRVAVGVVAMVFSTGWYIAPVGLWPADARPYIAGSTDNSLLQLALGYNGIQRITGNNQPGGGGGTSWWWSRRAERVLRREPGLGRLFNDFSGTESWLLPAALTVWSPRCGSLRQPAHRQVRAVDPVGGLLVVTGAVFCFMTAPCTCITRWPRLAQAALLGISKSAGRAVNSRACWKRAVMLAGTGV